MLPSPGERLAARRAQRQFYLRRARRGLGLGPARHGGARRVQGRGPFGRRSRGLARGEAPQPHHKADARRPSV
eukprot:15049411-Alexandrium_andersonii.AAC.1